MKVVGAGFQDIPQGNVLRVHGCLGDYWLILLDKIADGVKFYASLGNQDSGEQRTTAAE